MKEFVVPGNLVEAVQRAAAQPYPSVHDWNDCVVLIGGSLNATIEEAEEIVHKVGFPFPGHGCWFWDVPLPAKDDEVMAT